MLKLRTPSLLSVLTDPASHHVAQHASTVTRPACPCRLLFEGDDRGEDEGARVAVVSEAALHSGDQVARVRTFVQLVDSLDDLVGPHGPRHEPGTIELVEAE